MSNKPIDRIAGWTEWVELELRGPSTPHRQAGEGWYLRTSSSWILGWPVCWNANRKKGGNANRKKGMGGAWNMRVSRSFKQVCQGRCRDAGRFWGRGWRVRRGRRDSLKELFLSVLFC